MRYLQVGVACEGDSDFEYLRGVLPRLLDEILVVKSTMTVEVATPLPICPGARFSSKPADVVAVVRDEYEFLDILLYHTDAAGDVTAAYENRVRPVRDQLCDTSKVVGVVPRRETEAWAVADALALRSVLGLRETYPMPADFRPARVEGILDPKRELRACVRAAPTRRVRQEPDERTMLSALGKRARLDLLVQVPQFSRMSDDLEQALSELEVLL